MRLSGVLPDDDDGSTDLATLEKRLTDRASQRQTAEVATPAIPTTEDRRASSVQPTQKASGAASVQPSLPSPRSGTTSPEPARPEKGDEEEETLAEMMCSLVTNNYGETRYIGESCFVWRKIIGDALSFPCALHLFTDLTPRFIIGFFHFLTKRHSMGQREDWRCLLPRDDIKCCY
jgi:hypothetical protein